MALHFTSVEGLELPSLQGFSRTVFGSQNARILGGEMRYSSGVRPAETSNLAHDFETPFDSIEGAQEYFALMMESVIEARQSAETDMTTNGDSQPARRKEALALVLYKLEKLEQHIKVSRRLLNDLRTLRRLLFEEREQTTTSYARSGSKRSA